MTGNASFGECLKSILHSRELSVLETSRLLGMKSATSLSRMIHDEVNVKTLEKEFPRLVQALALTPQEKEQLSKALLINRLGVEQYLGYRSMWQLLFPQQKGEKKNHTTMLIMGGMSTAIPDNLQQWIKALMDYSRVEIVMTGCCTREIIGAFYPLTRLENHVRMIHFLPGQYASVRQVIGGIAAITPFLPGAWYSAYLPGKGTPPEIAALYERNEILIDATDQAGERRLYHLVQVEKAGMQLIEYKHEVPFQFHRQLLMRHLDRLTPVKTIFPTAASPEDYIVYTEHYREIEENKAIYSIKPDIPINFIHPDLMVAAVTEGFTDHAFVSRDELAELVGRLYQIHLKRWKNIYEKKKVTHIVFSPREMMEFAQTGVETDHFFAIRPFTPHERRLILQHIRRQMAENPYFNVYFSADDHMPFQFEMTAYDQLGVQLTHARTSYNLAAGHSEVLINQPEFLNIFVSFYQLELLQEHVLSARENLFLMDQIIASIPEK